MNRPKSVRWALTLLPFWHFCLKGLKSFFSFEGLPFSEVGFVLPHWEMVLNGWKLLKLIGRSWKLCMWNQWQLLSDFVSSHVSFSSSTKFCLGNSREFEITFLIKSPWVLSQIFDYPPQRLSRLTSSLAGTECSFQILIYLPLCVSHLSPEPSKINHLIPERYQKIIWTFLYQKLFKGHFLITKNRSLKLKVAIQDCESCHWQGEFLNKIWTKEFCVGNTNL